MNQKSGQEPEEQKLEPAAQQAEVEPRTPALLVDARGKPVGVRTILLSPLAATTHLRFARSAATVLDLLSHEALARGVQNIARPPCRDC